LRLFALMFTRSDVPSNCSAFLPLRYLNDVMLQAHRHGRALAVGPDARRVRSLREYPSRLRLV
jgi:hypothetical protein